jgi:hypothetical protein
VNAISDCFACEEKEIGLDDSEAQATLNGTSQFAVVVILMNYASWQILFMHVMVLGTLFTQV